jgi:CDP-glycerol glycerophosphotransferase (TagB/SpsB family)
MLEFLEQNDLHMIFYLHGYAQGYAKYFKSSSDRVKVAYKEEYFVQDLLKQAAFLITDYSSVIFDFAYMKKPCLYFQYDKEMFEKSQYSESEDYSYEEDGFGPVCYTYETVLQYLDYSCRNGFVMEEQYAKRVEDYFPSFDKQHCQRIVKAIKSH